MDPADHVDRPLSPAGQRAAARAAAARRDVPRGCAYADADASELLGYCDRLNRMLGSRGGLRPFDLVIKVAAVALRRVPEVNATYLGDAIRFYTRVHIGLACPAGDDLVIPRIRDADLKNLADLGSEVRDLAARARSGDLESGELRRAAVAICDVGALGIDRAELSTPRGGAAMLTVGRVRREPVARGDSVGIGHRMSLAIGCDERVAGATAAARLLGEVVSILESPERLAGP